MELAVRTADRTRQGKLDLESGSEKSTTVGELMAVLRDEFKLPPETDYFLRSDRAGKQLDPQQTLEQADVRPGDVLEVAPILQAGHE